jgi:ATP-dependent 26S proteasome regulatory subunit
MSDVPAENAPAVEPINEESENAENVTQQREQSEREQVLEQYRAKIREHREVEARLKRMREDVKGLTARYQKTEDDLSALQSVGQIIGDVLKRLDAERFIVKASSGPRYVVGCRARLNHGSLKPGTRVALDMTTLTIMRVLPREVDPTVFHMQAGEEDGGVSFADIGGLNEQIRELREVIELPLTNPELFIRVGIKVSIKNGIMQTKAAVHVLAYLTQCCLVHRSTHNRLPRVSCCTDPQELERLCSPVLWLATLLPPFSKSSPLPL